VSTTSIREIPLDDIVCGPQVRSEFGDESLAGLAQSLAETGLQQPVRLRRVGDKFTPVVGERRIRAAKLAGWKTIPAIVDEKELGEAELLAIQLSENLQREDLRPVEKARAIARLMQASGCTAAEVAANLGLSPASVSKLRPLLLLPEAMQELIDAGKIPASTGYEIAKEPNPTLRAQLAREAADGNLTRNQAATRSSKRRAREPRRKRPVAGRVAIALGGGRTVRVSGPGLTVALLVELIEDLLTRVRSLASPEMDLDEASRALSQGGK
jgi:ParB family chromosome partitioning protein